ncbi:MAG: DNA translocase FtsK 4TM domain-containing protein [Candidatus Limnocylindrus sp.]
MARKSRSSDRAGGRFASSSALRTIIFLAFAVTGVVLAVGLLLPGRGLLADALRDVIAPWFGAGRWILPPALIGFGIWYERRAESATRLQIRITLALVALIALHAIIEILLPGRGGAIGRIAGNGLSGLLTSIGALAVWTAILIGIGLLLAETQVRRLFSLLFGTATLGAGAVAKGVGGIAAAREAARERRAAAADAELSPSEEDDEAAEGWDDNEDDDEEKIDEAQPIAAQAAAAPAPLSATFAPPRAAGASVRDGAPIRRGGALGSGEGRSYELPELELLEAHAVGKGGAGMDHDANSRIIVEKLASFGIPTEVVGMSAGPVVTQYELEPDPSVRVSRIEALSDDLAMALSARSIRIEAPIPGRSVVGIEIPNRDTHIVGLRSIFEEVEFASGASQLVFALGRDVAGAARAADLTRMPHLLIAGATGSGKSVMVNALIASLLFRSRPQELRLILVDPKRVELSGYNGLPHLLVPVITEADKASAALRWAVTEMESRYRIFAAAGSRNLAAYNESRADDNDRLPFIVIIIDELADLMMQDGRATEEPIVRIAQKARATGIHMVLATQRPSVNVVTGLIKANIPSRIAFSMASQIDSRTVLDAPGAEDLIGRGDMLFQPSDAPKPIRLQGVFVSDAEIAAVVEHWRNQGLPDYQMDIVEAGGGAPGTGGSRGDGGGEEADRLFEEAVAVVQEHDRASASLLQRRLRIGYARAARIIDQLEERGYIGAFDGSNARVVNRNAAMRDGGAPSADEEQG